MESIIAEWIFYIVGYDNPIFKVSRQPSSEEHRISNLHWYSRGRFRSKVQKSGNRFERQSIIIRGDRNKFILYGSQRYHWTYIVMISIHLNLDSKYITYPITPLPSPFIIPFIPSSFLPFQGWTTTPINPLDNASDRSLAPSFIPSTAFSGLRKCL